jgi:hypothetical protein
MQNNILIRIRPILFAIFAVAASHNLFFVVLPKQSGELIKHLVSHYPERPLEIAHSLHDLFILRKERINAMIQEALIEGADDADRTKIDSMIQHITRELAEENELQQA